jgi:hypothetical protein
MCYIWSIQQAAERHQIKKAQAEAASTNMSLLHVSRGLSLYEEGHSTYCPTACLSMDVCLVCVVSDTVSL